MDLDAHGLIEEVPLVYPVTENSKLLWSRSISKEKLDESTSFGPTFPHILSTRASERVRRWRSWWTALGDAFGAQIVGMRYIRARTSPNLLLQTFLSQRTRIYSLYIMSANAQAQVEVASDEQSEAPEVSNDATRDEYRLDGATEEQLFQFLSAISPFIETTKDKAWVQLIDSISKLPSSVDHTKDTDCACMKSLESYLDSRDNTLSTSISQTADHQTPLAMRAFTKGLVASTRTSKPLRYSATAASRFCALTNALSLGKNIYPSNNEPPQCAKYKPYSNVIVPEYLPAEHGKVGK